jgi:hypothetical protein
MCQVHHCIPLQVFCSIWEVPHSLIAISPLPSQPARQVLSEMPKPAKLAQIDHRFFQHLHDTLSNIFAKFHANLISQTPIYHRFPFIAIDTEPSAINSLSSPNFKPSAHFTLMYSYIPIREVLAQFHVISCPISNFKPPMAYFLVQTSFSRRLSSVSPNHFVSVS